MQSNSEAPKLSGQDAEESDQPQELSHKRRIAIVAGVVSIMIAGFLVGAFDHKIYDAINPDNPGSISGVKNIAVPETGNSSMIISRTQAVGDKLAFIYSDTMSNDILAKMDVYNMDIVGGYLLTTGTSSTGTEIVNISYAFINNDNDQILASVNGEQVPVEGMVVTAFTDESTGDNSKIYAVPTSNGGVRIGYSNSMPSPGTVS